VVLLYDAFLEAVELLEAAVDVARQRSAPLEEVAYVPAWRSWLF